MERASESLVTWTQVVCALHAFSLLTVFRLIYTAGHIRPTASGSSATPLCYSRLETWQHG